MPKIVTASEAKTRFGAMMEYATSENDEVIVRSYGEPKAVIMSYEAYEQVAKLRERERRAELWRQMEALRMKVSSRNQDLSEEEADALAQRFTREVVEDMIREGKIQYELDLDTVEAERARAA